MQELPIARPRHDWKRVGGPLASIALHVLAVWVLIQRVGPALAVAEEGPEIVIGPAPEEPHWDPPPENPPAEPDLADPSLAPTSLPGPTSEIPDTPDLPDGLAGPPDDVPGLDLAPVPLGPLTIRGLPQGGGGAGGSFGYGRSLEGDLVGTMYDLKRDAQGATRVPDYLGDVRHILAGRLSAGAFAGFYRVTNQLYMTHLFVPVMAAEQGPAAFAAGDAVQPQNWLVHYRGSIRAPRAGTYRFVGMFDDLLMVLVDGKIVLEFLWTGDPTPWAPREFVDEHPCYAGRPLVYGDWVDLDPREPHRIDLLVGEHPGGKVGGVLLIQEQGRAYAYTPEGRPILPVFTVQPPTLDERVRMVRFQPWAFAPEIPVFRLRPAARAAEQAEAELKIEIL